MVSHGPLPHHPKRFTWPGTRPRGVRTSGLLGRFATDVTDAAGSVIDPFLTSPSPLGRRRSGARREVVDAIWFVPGRGRQRRAVPACFRRSRRFRTTCTRGCQGRGAGPQWRHDDVRCRRTVSQGAMRPRRVAIRSPRFTSCPGIRQAQGPGGVQALDPEPPADRPENALSVGFPGREKPGVTPLSRTHGSSALLMNSGP